MSEPTNTNPALEKIAEALAEIGETLETMLGLLQEREAGFKARAGRPSFGDRKPYERKSYSRDDAGGDDEGGERKPYRKPYGDKPAYAAKRSYGDKPAYGEKKSFGGGKRSFSDEKKPYKPRGTSSGAGDKKSAPRKTYKGGY